MIRNYLQRRRIKNYLLLKFPTLELRSGCYFEYVENINIGDYCFINDRCFISGKGGIEIGENVIIGPEVKILSSSHDHNSNKIPYSSEKDILSRVVIKDHVWVAAFVTILPGVTIGEGAIIGASSVVAKDVEAYSIVAGNPAIHKKYRDIANFIENKENNRFHQREAFLKRFK